LKRKVGIEKQELPTRMNFRFSQVLEVVMSKGLGSNLSLSDAFPMNSTYWE
jgi:hypothetical protein